MKDYNQLNSIFLNLKQLNEESETYSNQLSSIKLNQYSLNYQFFSTEYLVIKLTDDMFVDKENSPEIFTGNLKLNKSKKLSFSLYCRLLDNLIYWCLEICDEEKNEEIKQENYDGYLLFKSKGEAQFVYLNDKFTNKNKLVLNTCFDEEILKGMRDKDNNVSFKINVFEKDITEC